MSSRAEKALKAQKEKHHSILRELVQEPSNKTCADCLAKGPRWSSWSLGVFVCIRCAGIHRNLGVHISKVKSVDLDSWNTEQIEHILKWGNKRASEYFECYLPKDFTRPQGNHAVESFIRNKYEKKLYIKKDGEPEPNPTNKLDRLKASTVEKESKPQANSKRRERPEKKTQDKSATNTILDLAQNQKVVTPPASAASLGVASSHHVKSHSMNDLLSLDHPGPTTPDMKPAASSNDLLNFGVFSDPVPAANPDPFQIGVSGASTASNELLLSGNSDPFQTASQVEAAPSEPVKSTKESIMSLYSSAPSQQQKMYGVPGGVYMQQQPQQQQQQHQQQGNMMYSGYPPMSMSNQMGSMNAQMTQMNLNSQMTHKGNYSQPSGFNMQQSGFNPQMSGMQMQQQPFGQQQQLGYNQQQYNPYSQAGFGTQNAYNGSNMMGQTQINNFPQQTTNMQQSYGYNMAQQQNAIKNTSWTMGAQQQQNGMTTNGAGTMNFNMNTSTMGQNSGHTMNNQLWN